MASNILETIVETKRVELAEAMQKVSLKTLKARAADQPPCRDFFSAIASPPSRTVNLIAEIKKASPSAGVIREDFDVAWIASRYEAAGARALSVLTDERYFKGSLDYIAVAKAACGLPALRKDFLIDAYQVYQARAAGADAVLLIAAILTDAMMTDLLGAAAQLGLACLVEVHDAEELDRVQALAAFAEHGRALLGVNNRNLKTFVTDCAVSVSLAGRVADKSRLVSESGIHKRSDVETLAAAGVRGILVGESLMRYADPADGIAELLG